MHRWEKEWERERNKRVCLKLRAHTFVSFVRSLFFLLSFSPYIYNIFAINPIQSIFRQFLLRFCFSLYSLSSYGLMSMISYEVMMTTLMLLRTRVIISSSFFHLRLNDLYIWFAFLLLLHIFLCVFVCFSISSYLNRCLCMGVILGRLSSLNVFLPLIDLFHNELKIQ